MAVAPVAARDSTCTDPIPVWEDGKATRSICASDAPKEGLTIVDLSDDYAPSPFADAPELGDKGKQPFRARLVAFENERFGDGPEFDRAKVDRYLELFGIMPSVGVVAKRLSDDARHACHAKIDDAPLAALTKTLNPWRDREFLQGEAGHADQRARELGWEAKKRGLESIDALRADPKYKAAFDDLDRTRAPVEAVAVVQAHLKCDGLLNGNAGRGLFDRTTADGLERFQRKHMIVSWELDAETREALLTKSGELDFRSLLRTLRERVVDATGLIEDGSAIGDAGLVLGRELDSEAMRPKKDDPIPNGAPDLISKATEEAAKALGWIDPDRAKEALASARPEKVALKLPPVPSYHSANMDLRAEIDRGDVNYDYPLTPTGLAKFPPAKRRPTLVLYAKDGDREVALMRWPTTIGGWKPERLHPRDIEMVYKESPEGPRIWRDLIVTPSWIPPDSAPKHDLVRERPDGEYVLNDDLFGPGYASAFGLVKLVHLRRAKVQPGSPEILRDEGIGTHGSVSYDSIHHGTSHGCHRLHNHLAIRLASFLLKHRAHATKGIIELGYARQILYDGKAMTLKMPSGGFKYELTPPVPVEVLRGRIVGKSQTPLKPHPLPENLAKLMVQERFEP